MCTCSYLFTCVCVCRVFASVAPTCTGSPLKIFSAFLHHYIDAGVDLHFPSPPFFLSLSPRLTRPTHSCAAAAPLSAHRRRPHTLFLRRLLAPNGREVCAHASGPRKQLRHTTRKRKRNTRIVRRTHTQGGETQRRSDALAPFFLLRVTSSNLRRSAGPSRGKQPPTPHTHSLAGVDGCHGRPCVSLRLPHSTLGTFD